MRGINSRPAVPVLDFVPRHSRPWLGWALLLVALACALVAGLEGLTIQDEAAAQSERLAQWQARGLQKEVPVQAPEGVSPAVRRQGPGTGAADAAAAAQQVSAALRYPWPGLWAALEEATPPGVKWLRLEHRAGPHELRLEGHAPDARTAIRTAEALALRSGWRSVVLTRLVASDPTRGRPGHTFDIQCRLEPSALRGGGL